MLIGLLIDSRVWKKDPASMIMRQMPYLGLEDVGELTEMVPLLNVTIEENGWKMRGYR